MGNNLIKVANRKRSNAKSVNENRKEQTQRNGENSNRMTVACSSNQNQHFLSSSIFTLNRHCFDELFDYLSLRDLHSLAQTCKSMRQMTGEFFARNYSGAKFNCLSDGIYMIDNDDRQYEVSIEKCIPIPFFIQFITWIAIENNVHAKTKRNRFSTHSYTVFYHCELDKFKFIKLHSDEFKSVKKMSLTNVRINKQIVGFILKILPNIEVLELSSGTITQDLYDILLKYCRNVRCIRIIRVNNNNKYKWLRKRYEKLEHLELCNDAEKIDELDEFFVRNPNLRSFSCDSMTFWSNKDALLNSKAKLDKFELKRTFHNYRVNEKTLWDFLYQLHTHGFYKRLHMYDFDYDYLRTDHLSSIPFLELLSDDGTARSLEPFSTHLIEYIETGVVWPFPWNKIMISGRSKNETFVESLMNVERLYVFRETFDILLFIKNLRNLKKLNLFKFESSEILQLDMLNTEREKLAGARKVTIYVPDAVYLATKWATKNGTTNFTLIEMKRSNSLEWYRFLWTHENVPIKLPPGIY